jgi:hypothetical protein
MKLVMASAFVLLTAFAPLTCAQIADAEKTGRVINGRGWTALNLDTKIGFVMGLYEGVRNDAKFQSPATVGEIIGGVTLFYREPANVRIPVVVAVLIFSSKVRGATPAEIEATTIWARTANFDKPVVLPNPKPANQ